MINHIYVLINRTDRQEARNTSGAGARRQSACKRRVGYVRIYPSVAAASVLHSLWQTQRGLCVLLLEMRFAGYKTSERREIYNHYKKAFQENITMYLRKLNGDLVKAESSFPHRLNCFIQFALLDNSTWNITKPINVSLLRAPHIFKTYYKILTAVRFDFVLPVNVGFRGQHGQRMLSGGS